MSEPMFGKEAFKRLDRIHEEFKRRRKLGLPYPEWDELPAIARGETVEAAHV